MLLSQPLSPASTLAATACSWTRSNRELRLVVKTGVPAHTPTRATLSAAMQLELNAALGSSRGQLKIAVTCQASEMLEAQH